MPPFGLFKQKARKMALIVQKYGGTSVGSAERIKNVAKRVAQTRAEGHDVVIVVSAMSGETNRLVALAHEMQEFPDPREMDVVLATGEQVTIGLLAMALKDIGVDAKSYTGWQVAVQTDNAHTKARIDHIDSDKIHADLKAGKVAVLLEALRSNFQSKGCSFTFNKISVIINIQFTGGALKPSLKISL